MTKEPAQQNLPGTTAEYPNWSRKMRWSIRGSEHPAGSARLRRHGAGIGSISRAAALTMNVDFITARSLHLITIYNCKTR